MHGRKWQTSIYIPDSKVHKFMGRTWGPPGPVGPTWGPCWPHEPCSQGCSKIKSPTCVATIFRFVTRRGHAYTYYSIWCFNLNITHGVCCPFHIEINDRIIHIFTQLQWVKLHFLRLFFISLFPCSRPSYLYNSNIIPEKTVLILKRSPGRPWRINYLGVEFFHEYSGYTCQVGE